mmetsp:Transcript_15355/g.46089  ORF Transcript_15355/g.46089 Transcript_15355/m.46089 type:complete len:397 (+) Transcript_15355:391-1581(+)
MAVLDACLRRSCVGLCAARHVGGPSSSSYATRTSEPTRIVVGGGAAKTCPARRIISSCCAPPARPSTATVTISPLPSVRSTQPAAKPSSAPQSTTTRQPGPRGATAAARSASSRASSACSSASLKRSQRATIASSAALICGRPSASGASTRWRKGSHVHTGSPSLSSSPLPLPLPLPSPSPSPSLSALFHCTRYSRRRNLRLTLAPTIASACATTDFAILALAPLSVLRLGPAGRALSHSAHSPSGTSSAALPKVAMSSSCNFVSRSGRLVSKPRRSCCVLKPSTSLKTRSCSCRASCPMLRACERKRMRTLASRAFSTPSARAFSASTRCSSSRRRRCCFFIRACSASERRSCFLIRACSTTELAAASAARCGAAASSTSLSTTLGWSTVPTPRL